MTRDEAFEALGRLAHGVQEEQEDAATARLLERLAAADPELKAALLEVGARALLREARG